MNVVNKKIHKIDNMLRSHPKGFGLEDIYSCIICSAVIGENQGWYDTYGPKCFICQKAFQENIIPIEALLNRTCWLAMWEVSQLGIHPRVIRMMMRKKELKPRIIKDDFGRIYFYIFMLSENSVLMKYNMI